MDIDNHLSAKLGREKAVKHMITQKPETNTIPRCAPSLHDCGLPDVVIDQLRIQPNGTGWLYPFRAGDTTNQRWKAYPGQGGAKYKWYTNGKPGRKPDHARFYDPAGDLADHIAAANGVLILATGEKDVWSCRAAGVFNATCTLMGEGSIPSWLLPEVARLSVSAVKYYPDRDDPGFKAAVKLNEYFSESEITFTAYELPYPMGSKADLNSVLTDHGTDGFLPVLDACPVLELPTPEPTAAHKPYNLPTDFDGLYERWCIEGVERVALRTWDIEPPNGNGYSRNNFPSPFRDDGRKASAGWDYKRHGIKDHGGSGDFYNTHQVAELLGVESWEDYKARVSPIARKTFTYESVKSRKAIRGENDTPSEHSHKLVSTPKTLPDLPYDQPRDPDVRLHPWHYTRDVQKLMILSLNRDFPDLPRLLLVDKLIGLVTRAESAGDLPLGAWLTEAALMELSGLTRHSTRTALQLAVDLGIFCRKRYCDLKEQGIENTLYHFQQKIGERGPATVFMLRDQDVAFDWLVSVIADNALRTATFKPVGTSTIIPDNLRPTPAYGLTADESERAKIVREPLLEKFAAERARAEVRIRRKARVLRGRLHAASQGYHDPAIIPDAPTPNKARHLDALAEHRRRAESPIGIRVETSAKTCAEDGFRDRQELRRSRERRLLVTDKRYKPKPLLRGDVLGQLPDKVKKRGWGLRLEASNGGTFEVTTKSYPLADAWAERQFAAGYTVTAQIQVASLERAATAEEITVLENKREKRLERQRERVRAYASTPREQTPANDHSAAYVMAQARLSLPDHFTENEGVLLNTRTGDQWDVSPQVLCQAVAGSLGRKEREEMTSYAAHTAEAYEDREAELIEVSEAAELPSKLEVFPEMKVSLRRMSDEAAEKPVTQAMSFKLTQVNLTPFSRPQTHTCVHCGAPAARRAAFVGYECDDCNDRGVLITLQNIRAQNAQYAAAGD